MSDEVRNKLRRRYDEVEATDPLQKLRHFLQGFVSDSDSPGEVRDLVRRQLKSPALVPGLTVRHALEGLEHVLRTPQPERTLSELVAFDANRSLDDPSDAGARRRLESLERMLREEPAASGARIRWPGEE